MRKFTVDRKRWKRGNEDSALQVTSGQQCCLGFYARACGVKRLTKKGGDLIPMLSDLSEEDQKKLDPQILKNEGKFSIVNDDESSEMKGEAREKELKRLFRSYGVVVNFVG